jgi:hypothetical protein
MFFKNEKSPSSNMPEGLHPAFLAQRVNHHPCHHAGKRLYLARQVFWLPLFFSSLPTSMD